MIWTSRYTSTLILRMESGERSDFHRKLAEKRSAEEKLQARPNVWETIESMASTYLEYFTWRMGG